MDAVSPVSPTKSGSGFSKTGKAMSEILLQREEGSDEQESFTYPQLSPTAILQETLHSLDSKVPLIPGLDEVLLLCTTKIGTKRFQTPVDAEFDLRSPQSPGVEYNNLHDPHLKKYFQKPYVRNSLTKQGLITEEGFVKCSTREFNDYRQWIRRLKLNKIDAIEKERQERERQQLLEDDDLLVLKRKKLSEHCLETMEANKQKRFVAKKNYMQKKRKEKEERKRLMKNLEQEFKNKAELREDQQNIKKMKCKSREKEEEIRRLEHKKNEDEQKASRIQDLAEKDELHQKRQKEIKDYRKMDRKNKERKAIEKWKRRQSYCFRTMEQKKVQIEKEMQERKESMLKRNDIFNRERQKRKDELGKSMQLSREQAREHLRKANKFMEKAERKKEAEIRKWREKNLVRMSPKLHPQRPEAIGTLRSAKSRDRSSKRSMWKIDNCLNTNDHSDHRKSRQSTNDDFIDDRADDLLDGTGNVEEPVKENSNDLRVESFTDHTTEMQGESLVGMATVSTKAETRSSSSFGSLKFGRTSTTDFLDGKNSHSKNFSALDVRTSDGDLAEMIALSWQVAEEIVFSAAIEMGIDPEKARQAISGNCEKAELAEGYKSSRPSFLLPDQDSIHGSSVRTEDSAYEVGRNQEDSSVLQLQNDGLSATNSLASMNSSRILSTARSLMKGIVEEALVRLGLCEEECSRLWIEIEQQSQLIESRQKTSLVEHCNESRSSCRVLMDIMTGSSSSDRDNSGEAQLESVSQMLPGSVFSERSISIEAKRLAEDALRQALTTLDSVESLSCHVTKDSYVARETCSEGVAGLRSTTGSQVTESSSSSWVANGISSSQKSLDVIGQLSDAPPRCQSSGSGLNVEARSIAFKAIDDALMNIGLSNGEGTLESCNGPSDPIEGNFRSRAKSVVHDAIIGAAGLSGCRSREIAKVEEYLARSDSKHSEGAGRTKVRFHSSIDAAVDKTPSNHMSLLSHRLPTPHASAVNLLDKSSDHDVEAYDQTEADNLDDRAHKDSETVPEAPCGEMSRKENVTETSITPSGGSIERIAAMSKIGRRPTPYFSRTEKQRLFDKVAGGRQALKMDTFGENEEREEDGVTEVTEIGSKGMIGQPKFSNDLLVNSNEGIHEAGIQGSAPELGQQKRMSNYHVRRTVSSITPRGSAGKTDAIEGTGRQEECGNQLTGDNERENLGLKKGATTSESKCTVNDVYSESNAKVRPKPSLYGQRSSCMVAAKDSGERSHFKIGSNLAIGSRSKELLKSRSRIKSESSISGIAAKGSCLSVDRGNRPSSTRIDDQRGSVACFGDKRGSRVSCGSAKVIKRRLSDQVVSGKMVSDSAKSDNSLGSSSSHFLPHVRASKSRMTCRIDPSVYSCATDEVESKSSMDSGEMMGLTDDQETEQVVQIVQPESDVISQCSDERFLTEENARKVAEKLAGSLSCDDGNCDVDAVSLGKKGDEESEENKVAVAGSVSGFRYSEYVQNTARKDEGERLEHSASRANADVIRSKDSVGLSSDDGRENRYEARMENSTEVEAVPEQGCNELKESNSNCTEKDPHEHVASNAGDESNDLLQDFVVIEESELAHIKHVNSGKLGKDEVDNELNDVESQSSEKDKEKSLLENDPKEGIDAGATELAISVSQKSSHGEAVGKQSLIVNEARSGGEKQITGNEKKIPGKSNSLNLSLPTHKASLKTVSKSETGRSGGLNALTRTVSKASWLNFSRRRSKMSKDSIPESSSDCPKETEDGESEDNKRVSGVSIASMSHNSTSVEDQESRLAASESSCKEIVNVN